MINGKLAIAWANLGRVKTRAASFASITYSIFAFIALLAPSSSIAFQLSNTSALKTWWHSEHEFNSATQVADGKVRRSTAYHVRVSRVADSNRLFDSFTYMSIPRGGKQKWLYTEPDGAESTSSQKMTLSWSSFLYKESVWVEVEFYNATFASIDDVIIRPTNLGFRKVRVSDRKIRIQVPYRAAGYRFSVELKSDFVTYHTGHQEPKNGLMIFAQPDVRTSDVIPTVSNATTHYPAQGLVDRLHEVDKEIIYFRPGIYYMPWNYHATLRSRVKKIYLAPGAYVKGAFEFNASPARYSITGYGVLSGEKYVYEPDKNNGYKHTVADNCHESCIKMIRFNSRGGASLKLFGITVAEPPYHSFVAYGSGSFPMDIDHYKQIGSWYWQTDGLELYAGSTMHHTFFHANDDVIKTYHSDVQVGDSVVWKGENGPVIQFGWSPRNIRNVTVSGVDVIHNRMSYDAHNMCLINSARHWDSNGRADRNTTIQDVRFENIRSEGKTPCAFRIYANSNLYNVHFKNVWVESWNNQPLLSELKVLSDANGQAVTIGNETAESRGLKIENYKVGGQQISKWNDTWRGDQIGHLNFDSHLWDSWNCW